MKLKTKIAGQAIVLATVTLTWGALIIFSGCQPVANAPAIAKQSASVVDHELVYELQTTRQAEALCETIKRNWHPGVTAMLLEIVRFNQNPDTGKQVLSLLESQTGQRFHLDMNQWYQWIWNQPYDPHPQYAEFKSKVYSEIDAKFSEYFEKTDNAEIRLDEILWGGVKRDEIPPLENPEMISADEATYLADTNVVFGVVIDGDARCYPKRVLAWHEMFKDSIAGMPICGVY